MKKSVIILMLMCSIFMLVSCGEVAETSSTDIKFTLDITAGEEMMLDYIEEEYWVREDGEDYWFISVFAHTENGYYFSVTLENEDGTKTWDIDAIFDEDTGRFNYEECEIAKIDNDGMVEYLSESGSGYFYVKEGGLHWTDHTENISNWVFY